MRARTLRGLIFIYIEDILIKRNFTNMLNLIKKLMIHFIEIYAYVQHYLPYLRRS